jgi:hypothetical protein
VETEARNDQEVSLIWVCHNLKTSTFAKKIIREAM